MITLAVNLSAVAFGIVLGIVGLICFVAGLAVEPRRDEPDNSQQRRRK